MPNFSAKSREKLARVHPLLVKLFNSVVADYDCTILGGDRSLEQQRENVAKGLSKTMDSKHLIDPFDNFAHAVDVAPYPMPDDWDSVKGKCEQIFFAGKVMERARQLGIKIRYGGDWNRNGLNADNKFDDLDHFELDG